MSAVALIRVDASLEIGSGHLMRCLTLAGNLRDRGADVRFVSRSLPGNLNEHVRASGFQVYELHAPASPPEASLGWLGVDQEVERLEMVALFPDIGKVELLVVDHYALDVRWEMAVRPYAERIAVIDDLADRPHDADYVVDQTSIDLDVDRYRGLVPDSCVTLLGPHYAILRPQFAESRETLRERNGLLRRVLVFMGGMDVGGYTELALRAVVRAFSEDPRGPAVDVVIGPTNPRAAQIRQLCAESPRVEFYSAVENMAQIMASADVAIGAGGTASWERACVGLPCIVVVVADNQRHVAQALERVDCSIALEGGSPGLEEQITRTMQALAGNPSRLREMSQRGLALIDGRGALRLARALWPPRIDIRRADESDRDAIFQWRNHPQVRQHSHSSGAFTRHVHDQWFSRTLESSTRDLLIAEHSTRPVGVLRYDIDGQTALVSIYLVPGESGGGYGPAILRAGTDWLRRVRKDVRRVVAEVLTANAASHRAFREAGFTSIGSENQYELTL